MIMSFQPNRSHVIKLLLSRLLALLRYIGVVDCRLETASNSAWILVSFTCVLWHALALKLIDHLLCMLLRLVGDIGVRESACGCVS